MSLPLPFHISDLFVCVCHAELLVQLEQGAAVDCAGWRFEVLVLDGRRIDQVLIQPLVVAD